MDAATQAAIVDLLRQREMAFVRIWECETAIERIVGRPFPFPPPPPLPSRQSSGAGRPPGSAKPDTRPTLRRLAAPHENAYRIRYVFRGQPGVSFQTGLEVLRLLLGQPTPELQILTVETVYLRAVDDFDVVETLWSPPATA